MGRLPRIYAPLFHLLGRLGIHVTPNHFHFPIPDTTRIPALVWERESELPGIDLREEEQLALLSRLDARYGEEFRALPRTPTGAGPSFHLENGHFESVDAEIYYSLLRDRNPRRVLEIGAGFSTLLAELALDRNRGEGHPAELRICDPRPPRWARAGRGCLARVIPDPVQRLAPEEFLELTAGDVLFIDSSHVLAVGSDVQHLFLEVLPRLAPGVLVHLHDIFLPWEYPKYWVHDRLRFWNEQYVLQAFLAFNQGYRVRWASHFMARHHPETVAAAIPAFRPGAAPGSFWLERVG